jgi:hypothetical protein
MTIRSCLVGSAIGVCGLRSRSCPPGLIVFFKSGMLAWNGVISWWVLLASFAFWVLLLAYGLLRHAIPHQLRHENAAA